MLYDELQFSNLNWVITMVGSLESFFMSCRGSFESFEIFIFFQLNFWFLPRRYTFSFRGFPNDDLIKF